MKKIIFSISILSLLAFSSCKKNFLDVKPTSSITSGSFYLSQQDIQQAVTGVYAGLRDWPVDIYWYLSEVRSKNYFVSFDGAQRDWYDFSNFSDNPSDQTLHDTWQSLYRTIERANEVLEKMDNVAFTAPSLKTQYKAEVRFLRAYSYFQLVRLWNKVPLVTKVITPSEALDIKQSAPADVYAFITSEMNSIKDSLPVKYTASGDMGRATQWAVKGVLGKVYLTMAGYPLNNTAMLDSARIVLNDIIDHEGQYPHLSVTTNYADLFGYKNDNQHAIFEVQYITGGVGEGSTFPSQNIPPGLSTSLVNVRSLLFTSSVQVSTDLINSYNPNDSRFGITIDTAYPTNDNPPQVGHTPFYKKFVDFGLTTLTNYDDWPENFPLLRYEDVKLMYAEVLNDQAGAPPAEAIAILNEIRTRSGLDPITPATKDEFALAMEEERRHEFADEGKYWFDLVRTNRAIPVMNEWFQATGQNKTIDEHNLIYPIPQTEIDIYPGLYQQNPGY